MGNRLEASGQQVVGNRLIDLTGRRFGRWTVLKWWPKHSVHPMQWESRCDCGRIFYLNGSKLTAGLTRCCRSCRRVTHGQSGAEATLTYRTWKQMRNRCNNPHNKDYHHYGGRGIKICKAWENYDRFRRDMGERPEGMTLDRIDVNKGYSAGNCRWVTQTAQMRNTRVNRYLLWNGKTKSLAEWCEELKLSYYRVHSRLRRGWPLKYAFDPRVFTSRHDRVSQGIDL